MQFFIELIKYILQFCFFIFILMVAVLSLAMIVATLNIKDIIIDDSDKDKDCVESNAINDPDNII